LRVGHALEPNARGARCLIGREVGALHAAMHWCRRRRGWRERRSARGGRSSMSLVCSTADCEDRAPGGHRLCRCSLGSKKPSSSLWTR
jgi:hypothetical protein